MGAPQNDNVAGGPSPRGESRNYRIRVAGRLGSEWSDLANGMTVEVHRGRDDQTTSDLVGPLIDQAQLMGILDRLYTLGAQILRVDRFGEDDDDAPAP